MLKSLFNRGEPVSPTPPSLVLGALIAEGPESPDVDWVQQRGRFLAACDYIYVDRSPTHSSYHTAHNSIVKFIERYLPHWSLSSESEEVETAFVWAVAKVISSNVTVSSVASVMVDKLVSNGAYVKALRAKLTPTGILKVMSLMSSRSGEMADAISRRQRFDVVDAVAFLNAQFMFLRSASYLSWHSGASKELSNKFPNIVAYRNLRNK